MHKKNKENRQLFDILTRRIYFWKKNEIINKPTTKNKTKQNKKQPWIVKNSI